MERVSVIVAKLESLTPQLSSDNLAQQEKALKTLDELIQELLRIVKKDPEFYNIYEELIKGLESLRFETGNKVAQRRETVLDQRVRNPDNPSLKNQAINSGSGTKPQGASKNNEIKASSTNIQQNPNYSESSKTITVSNPTQLYNEYAAMRLNQGNKYKEFYNEYVDEKYNDFKSSAVCGNTPAIGRSVALSQEFTTEPCPFGFHLPWSRASNIPGTQIQFQYTKLYFCNVPPATIADKIASIIDDYAFVRIINNESYSVRGKVEFEYVDDKGKIQRSFERFVLEPGEKAEELGMWYLACKFLNVKLVELSCN